MPQVVIMWNIFCFYWSFPCFASYCQCMKPLASLDAKSFWIEVPRTSIFKHDKSLNIHEEHVCNHILCARQNIPASIHSTTFTLLHFQHLRSHIQAEQHSRYLLQAAAPTMQHPHLVACTPLHSWCYDSTWETCCKRSKRKDASDGVTVKASIEIWDCYSNLCNILCMQEQAAQQHDKEQRSLQRGAAGKLTKVRLPLVPVFPSERGKNLVCWKTKVRPEKTCTTEKFVCRCQWLAWLGWLVLARRGWPGWEGKACPGWEAGQGRVGGAGGRAC